MPGTEKELKIFFQEYGICREEPAVVIFGFQNFAILYAL
jgi:hypothetical protein